LWHRSYAVDCRTQSCPNTRWRRIGGGGRAADTVPDAPVSSAFQSRAGRPQRPHPLRATAFLGRSLMRPVAKLFVGCPVSKSPPQSIILMLLTKGRRERQSAIRQQIHPHQTGGAAAENESRRPSRTGSAPSSAPNPQSDSLPTPLPGAASGCNVKPNAKAAATEAAAERLAVTPLAGVLDACWTAVLCRSQAISRIYDCSARCRESP
jgi:hypothetical protein